jgi:hypothetical protein
VKQVERRLTTAARRYADVKTARDNTIRDAAARGMSYRQIAAATGLSHQRIAQIVKQQPPTRAR